MNVEEMQALPKETILRHKTSGKLYTFYYTLDRSCVIGLRDGKHFGPIRRIKSADNYEIVEPKAATV